MLGIIIGLFIGYVIGGTIMYRKGYHAGRQVKMVRTLMDLQRAYEHVKEQRDPREFDVYHN